MIPVVSSQIKAVGYDEDESELFVQFKNGRIYVYHEVPNREYVAILNASSPGTYFADHIKSKFEYQQL